MSVTAWGQEVKLVSAEPADNATVNELSVINAEWEWYTPLGMPEIKGGSVLDAADNEVATLTISIDPDDFTGNKTLLTLSKTITEPGTYTVSVPEGLIAFENGDGPCGSNAATQLHYTITDQKIEVPPLTFETKIPGTLDGETFPNISLVFKEKVTATKTAVAMTSSTGETYEARLDTKFMGMGENQILVLCEGITTAGDWTLHIPAGLFQAANGAVNEEFSQTWTYAPQKVEVKPLPQLVIESLTWSNGPQTVNLLEGGAAIPGFMEGDVISCVTNVGEEAGLMNLEVSVPGSEESRHYQFVKGKDNVFTLSPSGSFKFLEGSEYTLTFTALDREDVAPALRRYAGDPVTVTVKGTSQPYIYSNVTVVSVTPTPNPDGQEISDPDQVITITFSAPVTVLADESGNVEGQGMSSDFASLTSNEDRTVWYIKPGAGFISMQTVEFYISVAAVDDNGLRLEGNSGFEGTSCFSYSWPCYLAVPETVITPAAGTVDELFTFKAACASKPINLGSALDLPYVTDSKGNLVAKADPATAVSYDKEGTVIPPNAPESMKPAYITFDLNRRITDKGEYTLVCPFAAFSLGEQFSGCSSLPMNIVYTVSGQSGVGSAMADNISVRTADGQVIVSGIDNGVRVSAISMTGMTAASAQANGNVAVLDVAPGLYIIAIELEGKIETVKVSVR